MADPCKDLSSAVRVGQGTLMLLRTSGRDVLPFRCGPSLTTYMVDYIPPILMPGYTGGYPGISTCFSTTGGAVTRRNLQSERIDILGSRVVSAKCLSFGLISQRPAKWLIDCALLQRRKFMYGRLPCDFSPYPDVASAKKVMKWKKLAEPGNIIPTNVDECKRDELRYFHEVGCMVIFFIWVYVMSGLEVHNYTVNLCIYMAHLRKKLYISSKVGRLKNLRFHKVAEN